MPKPYLTYEEQIEKLSKDKGLIISDPVYAKQMLTDVGYVSLIGGYKTPFIDSMTRIYHPDVSFEDIVALYFFDKKLRFITFDHLVTIEQKIGQLISDAFCRRFGETESAYLDARNYTSKRSEAVKISKLINLLSRIKDKDTHDYIDHQRKTYGNVPLWFVVKTLTFGQLSKMYSVLQAPQQRLIASAFANVTDRSLSSFLSALPMFRNVCAHNERLYTFKVDQHDFPDTPLHAKLSIPQKGSQYTLGKKDYFGLVIAFRYLLPRQDFLSYKRELRKLINSYSQKNPHFSKEALLNEMGMPENWEHITRYRL